MKVSIITIGDELLIGQVINRNAAWIASKCTELGMTVWSHSVIGDEADELKSEIIRLGEHSDALLLTGGLGPTHDDITKDVLADMAGDELVERPEWVEHLQEWMGRSGRELTDRNRAQALVPTSATLIDNPIGTAPGLCMRINGTRVYAMPGVPAEMRSMVVGTVLPELQEILRSSGNEHRQYKVLQTTGIVESNLADLLGPLEDFMGSSSLAFLPNYKGVRLRIGAKGATPEARQTEIDRVAAEIRQRAERFIYGEGEVALEEAVGSRLKERGENVAVAESCTGGLLGGAFTNVSGSSAWFEGGVLTYSNEAKVRELGVSQADLDSVGAVSEEVALQMARGVRERFGTTWGIGVTGIAGPGGGTEDKPVGTVWISVSGPKDTIAKRFVFGTDRTINRQRSVGTALAMLWGRLR